MRVLFVLSTCLVLAGCGATRKLSQVGLREPSSVRENEAVSELRSRIHVTPKMASTCPGEAHLFPELAMERVKFPTCPSILVESFQLSMKYLKIEERTTLEEVIGSQCRSLAQGQFGDSLETLLANFETTGPLGRRKQIVQTVQSMSDEIQTLTKLKQGLEEVVYKILPLDRWVEANGEYLIPEEELARLEHLLIQRSCRAEERVDKSYDATRALEDLARVLEEGEQRTRLETFLNGIHKIIDEKIREFFYPNE